MTYRQIAFGVALFVTATLSSMAAGCGGDDTPPPTGADAGRRDGGSVDSGGAPTDGSMQPDTGGDVDAGGDVDSGPTEPDAGGGDIDSGGGDIDSGGVEIDAGVRPVDASLTGCGMRCGPRMYCMTPDGMCTAAGMCVPRPDACIDIFRPVCGCNGTTYSNSCYAALAGQSVASEGACTP